MIGDNWDAKAFAEKHKELSKRISQFHDSNAFFELKNVLAALYKETTIKAVMDGCYRSSRGKINVFDASEEILRGSCFYLRYFTVDDIPARSEPTKIVVENIDSFDAAEKYGKEGYNTIVLNMANRQTAGGGVLHGARAQEETLFRRSNLFVSLYHFTKYAHLYGLPQAEMTYPMDRNFGGVYSPGITVFRGNPTTGYEFLEKPFKTAVVSVAAINRPDLASENKMTDEMAEGTKNKMRTMLRIGLKHGHDCIILGAMGCGAFRNPPKHVAQLFSEVFEEPEFKNKYKLICFAILEDHNSKRPDSPAGNFQPFYDQFCN